jgi:hypothetical protein
MLNFLCGTLFTLTIVAILGILASGYVSFIIGGALVFCGAALILSIYFLDLN